MGMLSHVMHTAHLLMCYPTLSTLHLSSCSCMLLALHKHHPALLSVYTAKLPHAVTLYLSSCSPFCLHYTSICSRKLPTLQLPFCSLMLPTKHTFPSAPSCYLHSTPSHLLPHATYTAHLPICSLMLRILHLLVCSLMLPTLHLHLLPHATYTTLHLLPHAT